MDARMQCPKCASDQIDVLKYESMVVLSRDHALFTMHCPACSARVSTVQEIPEQLLEDVRMAAREVGAGMGCE